MQTGAVATNFHTVTVYVIALPVFLQRCEDIYHRGATGLSLVEWLRSPLEAGVVRGKSPEGIFMIPYFDSMKLVIRMRWKRASEAASIRDQEVVSVRSWSLGVGPQGGR